MDTYEILIHGEFNYIYRAFLFVAHMFSANSNYAGLIYSIGASAILFGGFTAVTREFSSARNSILTWFLTTLFASVVIFAVCSSKSQVIVRDLTTNEWKTISGVPTVMAFIAHIENNIEINMKELIEDTMSPVIPYDAIGKGKGFELLAQINTAGKDFLINSPFIKPNIEAYWKNCVVPDMSYGRIDPNIIHKSSDIFQSIKSKNQVLFTSILSQDNPIPNEKNTFNCADAWQKLDLELSNTKMNGSLNRYCITQMGDYANDACKNMLSSVVNLAIDDTANLNSYFRSYVVADTLMSTQSIQDKALIDMNKRNMASAVMAEKVLPRLKGMMYGLIIGIFPFLITFLWISPIKTVIFYSGMFIMMIIWACIDTFMDMQYQAEVINMFRSMKAQGLGIHQMFDISNISADAVSLYGQGRWMALGLATAISGAITGANTYAMNHLGSSLSATALSSAGAGADILSSAGQARNIEQIADEKAYRDMLSSSDAMANVTTGAYNSAIQGTYNRGVSTNINESFYGSNESAGSMQGATSSVKLQQTVGNQTGEQIKANALGFQNFENFNTWKNSNGTINNDMAVAMSNNGLNSNLAMNMVGLKLDNINTDANGNITNIQTSGIRDGKNWSVNEAGIQSTYIVGDSPAMISGYYMRVGTTVTQTYDVDGNLTQISANGGGYSNFTLNTSTGFAYGTHSEIHNGSDMHTTQYNGANATETYSTADGGFIQKSLVMKNGEYIEKETIITAGDNGFNYGGMNFEKGSTATISMDGITNVKGVTENGYTNMQLDNNGNIIKATNSSGINTDINNGFISNSGTKIITGFDMTSATALDQALNAKTGADSIHSMIASAYQKGDMTAYNNLKNEYANELTNGLFYKEIESNNWNVSNRQSIDGRINVYGQTEIGIDSDKSIIGKGVSLATGVEASVKGGIRGDLTTGVGFTNTFSDQTMTQTESVKIDIAKSIDTIMASGGSDVTLAHMMQDKASSLMNMDNRGLLTGDKAISENNVKEFYDSHKVK